MDTIRRVGTYGDEIKEIVVDRCVKAREVTTQVHETSQKRLLGVKQLLQQQKSKEQFAETSLWSQRYDTRLTEKLKSEVKYLEEILREKNEKLKNGKKLLSTLEKQIQEETSHYGEAEKYIIEERRRYELFLGLRFGKIFPGEIRFFFTHIDPNHPGREFAFSIRTEGRIHRVVDCDPNIGDKARLTAEKLSAGRLSIAQVVCEMRAVFKQLVVP